jgi:ubiquinone/menaquinone biosynthesis C-methylase UbiE
MSYQPATIGTEGRTLAQHLRLDQLPSGVFSLSPAIGVAIVRLWYRYLTHIDRNHEMTFMNYGYAETGPDVTLPVLDREDESNRYCIQLYQHLTEGVDLKGRDVLEIACGRGGGASFIARYLKPASLTGIDIAARAIEFCNRHYGTAGLTFARGEAEALDFGHDSFDAVINVESSHYYRSMPRFLAEVRSVLKPGGWFLFADFRKREEMPALRRQLVEAGFEVVRETNITDNILRALEVDNDRKLALIHKRVPWLFRKAFKEFAGTPGSATYESFSEARWEYSSFITKRCEIVSPTRPQTKD